MNTEKSIEVLNKLIEINNDRIQGYETAARGTFEVDLKLLFSQCQQTSEKCKAELVEEVQKLGGVPLDGANTIGKINRVLMDVKSAFGMNDRMAILNSCESVEAIVVDTYSNVLKNNPDNISTVHHELLDTHYVFIKAEYYKIKGLRDQLLVKG